MNITGNNYTNISMGVTHKESSDLYKGSVHRLVKVANVEMSNERYVNVGGYTTDHLEYIITQIKTYADES